MILPVHLTPYTLDMSNEKNFPLNNASLRWWCSISAVAAKRGAKTSPGSERGPLSRTESKTHGGENSFNKFWLQCFSRKQGRGNRNCVELAEQLEGTAILKMNMEPFNPWTWNMSLFILIFNFPINVLYLVFSSYPFPVSLIPTYFIPFDAIADEIVS